MNSLPLTTTNKTELWDSLTTRNNITRVRHDLATNIQLDHIIFKIHELADVAIYNPKKNLLIRKDIKEIVEPYIFPILSNTHDNKIIKSFFEILYYEELINFNKTGYSFINGLECAIGHKQKAMKKIRNQIKKQKELRKFYNYDVEVEGVIQ